MSFPSASLNALRNSTCYLINGPRQASGFLSSEATDTLSQLMRNVNPLFVSFPSLVSYKIRPVTNPSSYMVVGVTAAHTSNSMAGGAAGAAAVWDMEVPSKTYLYTSSHVDDSALRKDLDQLFLKANPLAVTHPSLNSYEITPFTNPSSYTVEGVAGAAVSESSQDKTTQEAPKKTSSFEVEDVTHEEHPEKND